MNQLQDIYRQFCAHETELPIFMQPWWLDVLCGQNSWGVSVTRDNHEKIIGTLTYGIFKKFGIPYLANPVLTPYVGPWLKTPQNHKIYELNSFQNQQIATLIAQLPRVPITIIKLFPGFDNAFPWAWAGFKPVLRHTYQLEVHSNLLEGYKESVLQDIHKSSARLSIHASSSAELLFQLVDQTFSRQGQKTPFSFHLLNRLYQEIKSRQAGQISYAHDASRRPVAGIMVVWDHTTAYYLLGARDNSKESAGAMSLLIHQQLTTLPSTVTSFDFEGSMIKGVEHFFRSFGGIRKNVLEVNHQYGWMGKIYALLKK